MAAKSAEKPAQQARVRSIEEKWTKTLTDAGWTAIPSVFLVYQKRLGLDPLDLTIVLQLAQYWWQSEKLPFPSKKSIAVQIGIDRRTVQRRISRMVKVGLLAREERWWAHGGQNSNAYRFSGLIEKAKPFAQEMKRERAEAAEARGRRPGKPALRAVKGGRDAAS
jgi:predicted transcriptional regulator